MKILNLAFAVLIFLVGCKSPVDKNKKQKTHIEKIQKEIKAKEKIYDTKCAIIYMPDSLQLTILEKAKSQEKLTEIEYDKTLALEFLDSKDIPVFIEDTKQYKFRKSNGEVIIIEKTSHPNWGIILFNPNKDPKVIFLNEVVEEYESFFN